MPIYSTAMYRIFDTTLDCQFPLPELPVVGAGAGAITVRLRQPGTLDTANFATAYKWHDAQGRLRHVCQRRKEEYLFTFPGHHNLRYHITADGVISCLPAPEASHDLMRHLLLNQVVPRYLASTGKLLLHASAVTLSNGKSVAFLGSSGHGKSTLASGFYHQGAQLIDDDCILVQPEEGVNHVIAGVPGIRLFPDSHDAIFEENAGFAPYLAYSDKLQFIPGAFERQSGPTGPRSLAAIFLLNDPGQEAQVENVLVERISGNAVMMAMISSAFCLDPSDRKMIASNFHNASRVSSQCKRLYSLSYPREHSRLPEVCAVVASCTGGIDK